MGSTADMIAQIKLLLGASKFGVPLGLGFGYVVVVQQKQARPDPFKQLLDVPLELMVAVAAVCVLSFIAHFVTGWMFKRLGEFAQELTGWFVRVTLYFFFLAFAVLIASIIGSEFDKTSAWLMVGASGAVGATEFVFWVRYIVGADNRARDAFTTMIRLRRMKKAIERGDASDTEKLLLGKEEAPQSDNPPPKTDRAA